MKSHHCRSLFTLRYKEIKYISKNYFFLQHCVTAISQDAQILAIYSVNCCWIQKTFIKCSLLAPLKIKLFFTSLNDRLGL